MLIMLWNYAAGSYFRSVNKAQQNLQEYLFKFFSYVEKPKQLFLRKLVSLAMLQFSLTNYTFWCRVVQNSAYTSKAHKLPVHHLYLRPHIHQKGATVSKTTKNPLSNSCYNTVQMLGTSTEEVGFSSIDL